MIDLAQLQASLPAGIKVTVIRGGIHYTVRSSRKGKKVSLGTYVNYEDAVEALKQFKFGVYKDSIQEVQNIRTVAKLGNYEYYKDLLDQIGVHMLESHKEYIHITEDGKEITIPAPVVTMYINEIYYGPCQDESIYPDDL
jgi:hypothetical protein